MNRIITLTAGEDLTGSEGLPVRLSSGSAVLCTSASDAAIGILTLGNTAGAEVEAAIFGDAGVIAGGAVTRGQLISLDSNGETCIAGPVSGATCLGIWLQDGVAGDTVPAFISPR